MSYPTATLGTEIHWCWSFRWQKQCVLHLREEIEKTIEPKDIPDKWHVVRAIQRELGSKRIHCYITKLLRRGHSRLGCRSSTADSSNVHTCATTGCVDHARIAGAGRGTLSIRKSSCPCDTTWLLSALHVMDTYAQQPTTAMSSKAALDSKLKNAFQSMTLDDDETVGNRLADLNDDKLPRQLKSEGHDWHAVHNLVSSENLTLSISKAFLMTVLLPHWPSAQTNCFLQPVATDWPESLMLSLERKSGDSSTIHYQMAFLMSERSVSVLVDCTSQLAQKTLYFVFVIEGYQLL